MNSKFVHGVIICLIALTVVPFGMNAMGTRQTPPIDPYVFQLFLATSLISWTALVFFSLYLSVMRNELANFAWTTVVGVFASYFLISVIFSAVAR